MTEPTEKEILAARVKIENGIEKAKKDLAKFKSSHEIAIPGECKDKDGGDTRVLILDTDKPGILGLFAEIGTPVSIDLKTGDITVDGKKVTSFLNFMSNIDMSDPQNESKIGWDAYEEAREIVTSFFTLRQVSKLKFLHETEKDDDF